tara:strand:+ start:881 stop:1081 length:201 start_codon:yes stop_codon:yes gene_type:complete
VAISIQNPLSTFDNRLVKKSKFLMVRTLAMQQVKNVTKAEDKVKRLTNEFQQDIHSGSTGGINVRI